MNWDEVSRRNFLKTPAAAGLSAALDEFGGNLARAAEALPWTWSQPISVLVSGCDRREVLDYNVYLAKTFKPMPESEQLALLERTKPRGGGEAEHCKIWTD